MRAGRIRPACIPTVARADKNCGMVSFDGVVDEYDTGRPSYPAAIYDALGPLAGRLVIEGGAGTGIATRQLVERGATVVPVDLGPALLRRAASRISGLTPVIADGAVLPFRDACADLVCFAQSWHWLDERTRCGETARVLRRGGRWAGWWSHARADGAPWFDNYWSLIEAACPAARRSQRDTDWGTGIEASGLFTAAERVVVPWLREVSIDTWMTDAASHSYIAALSSGDRSALLNGLAGLVRRRFPDGALQVPYETWMWIASVR
jgi:SAM-dependent methyltransferase